MLKALESARSTLHYCFPSRSHFDFSPIVSSAGTSRAWSPLLVEENNASSTAQCFASCMCNVGTRSTKQLCLAANDRTALGPAENVQKKRQSCPVLCKKQEAETGYSNHIASSRGHQTSGQHDLSTKTIDSAWLGRELCHCDHGTIPY